MGTPIAFMTGTTNGFSVGATKRATVGLNTGTSLVSGNNWWNGVDVSSQYLLYSDQFSQGQSTIPLSRPTAWSTPSITNQNLINLINTLPDRVGLPLFTDINLALQWLQNSQKYLLIKNGYENIVTDGLVLNLDAGWANSYPGTGTVWTDLSGNGINGTLTNGPTLSNDGLGTISFDGTNDYVNTTYTSTYNFTNANFTVEAWVYSNTMSSGSYNIICTRATYGTNERSFELFIANDTGTPYIWFGVFNSGWTYVNNQSLTNIQYNQWYHVVATSDGSGNGKVYINGVLRQTNSSFNTGVTVTTVPFQIGAYVGGASGGWLNGKIGCVRLYNKALSPTEIQQNYDVQKSRFGYWGQNLFSGVTQYLDFTKAQSYSGSGTDLYDISGNGYNDTITGAGAYTTLDGVKCLDCSGGAQINGDVNNSPTLGNNYTIFTWARVISSTSGFRTLLRTYTSDHPLLVLDGANTIGYYDNNGGGFIASSLDVGTLGLANRWVLYTIVGSSGTQQTFYINEGTNNSTVNANATGEKMDDICNHSGQIFGPVATCIVYNNQAFTQSQVTEYFNTTKQYFGYAPNNTITNGLVMSLDAGQVFSYPTTGDTWTDLTNNTNNVTLYNGPSFSATNGGYILFDGTNDYGLKDTPTGANFNVTNAITADAWIYYSPSDFDFWFTGTVDTTIKYRFGTNSSGNFYWDMGQHVDRNFSGYVLPSNTWNYVVFTGGLESGTIITRVYSNNVLRTTYDEGISTLPSVNKFYVGVGESPSSHPFNGRIAVLRIYDRVLTTGEITLNFNAQKARFGL